MPKNWKRVSPGASFDRNAASHEIVKLMNPRKFSQYWGAVLALAALILGGCETAAPVTTDPETAATAGTPPPLRLQAGDVISIAFPGAENLNTSQQIRRDGRINLPIVGEVEIAGKTPFYVETELKQLYSTQLLTGEVNVNVVSSSFAIYVQGAVLRPGKLQPERSVTVLDAVMEAGGGVPRRADLSKVSVIRTKNGVTERFEFDLEAILAGESNETFYLESYDIVNVPEKFSWF